MRTRTKFERYSDGAPTNKWHLVHSIDGVLQQDLYVRFILVRDEDGNKLEKAPVNQEVNIDLEYRTFKRD